MRRNWCTRIFAGVVMTVGLFASGASAQNAPDANAILEQSMKYSQSLNSFYADCLTTLTMAQGTKPMRSQIWAQMPDKLVMRMDSGDIGANIMYLNGNKQAIYFPAKNSYATAQVAPDGIKQNLQQLTSGGLGGDGSATGLPKGTQAVFVGKETITGIPTNHIRLTPPTGGSADMWIADGPQPLPIFSRMSMPQPPMTIDTLFRWSVNQPIPPATFEFSPPPGAKQMGGDQKPAAKPKK